MLKVLLAAVLAAAAIATLPAIAGAGQPDRDRGDRDAQFRAERFVRNTIEDFAPRRFDVDFVRADCGRRSRDRDRCDFVARLTSDDRWGRGDDDRRGRGDDRREGRRRNRDDIWCSGVVVVRNQPRYERVNCR